MPLFFQQNLPKEVRAGQWLKIDFTFFGYKILRVKKITSDRIVGFDLMSCEEVSLRRDSEDRVFNDQNWWSRQFDILSTPEVHRYAQERQIELDARVVKSRESLANAETQSANYRKKIPEVLKDLEKVEAA